MIKDAMWAVGTILAVFGIAFLCSCAFSTKNAEISFKVVQCSTMPSGRQNKEAVPVVVDGKMLGMAEKVTGSEWLTVCGKAEWR